MKNQRFVCCLLILCCSAVFAGALGGCQMPPEETEPPQSSTAAPSTEAPTEETTLPPETEPPTETTAPPVTEPPIRSSEAYQKLAKLKNADQFDPSVLDAFAQWIEERSQRHPFEYPDKWSLEQCDDGSVLMTFYTPVNEHSFRRLSRIIYDGKEISGHSGENRPDPNIPRETVAALVYGAADPIGISDEQKAEFIDSIMESDWFAWRTCLPELQTEWYFQMSPLYGSADPTEYITLFVKAWKPGESGENYTLSSLYHDGTAVQDRCQKEPHPGQELPTSVRDTVYYRKLQSIENAEEFDPAVLEAFARWIEENEAWFAGVYTERWELEEFYNGDVMLSCRTPLNEDYLAYSYCIRCDGETVSYQASPDRYYTSVPREQIAAEVYGAEDPIGVPDELKEAFIDFILDSDWFAWSVFSDEYYEKTEWYFVVEPKILDDVSWDCITLYVDVWDTGVQGADFLRNSLWYRPDLQEIWDGVRGKCMFEDQE